MTKFDDLPQSDIVPTRVFYEARDEEKYIKIEKADTPGAVGFPGTIMFQGTPEIEGEYGKTLGQMITMSFYEPIPGSYEETDNLKKIDYIHAPGKNYYLRVMYHKKANIWLADKFNKECEPSDRYYNEDINKLIKHILLSSFK